MVKFYTLPESFNRGYPYLLTPFHLRRRLRKVNFQHAIVDSDFIEKCCRMARRHFPTAHIHAFGLTLKALPRVLHYIDSWDSTAYYCSRESSGSGRGMCRNQKERQEYYFAYLNRVKEILHDFYKQKKLSEFQGRVVKFG